MRLSRLRFAFAASLVSALLLTGSAGQAADKKSSKENNRYVARDVETLYNAAKNQLDRKRYKVAAVLFDEVERQHPYSVWARRAELMSAFSHYLAQDYPESIESSRRFLSIHPGNKDAPYAMYLIAVAYYEQIGDVNRDQYRDARSYYIGTDNIVGGRTLGRTFGERVGAGAALAGRAGGVHVKQGAAEVRRVGKRALALEPDFAFGHYVLAGAYLKQQRYAEAVTEAATAWELGPDGEWKLQRGERHLHDEAQRLHEPIGQREPPAGRGRRSRRTSCSHDARDPGRAPSRSGPCASPR